MHGGWFLDLHIDLHWMRMGFGKIALDKHNLWVQEIKEE